MRWPWLMPQHDFAHLYSHYPAIIAMMPDMFTSHEFILKLAQQNQRLYIEALNDYPTALAPFRQVHAVLSQRLHSFPTLVRPLGSVASPDIFGESVECAKWQKL